MGVKSYFSEKECFLLDFSKSWEEEAKILTNLETFSFEIAELQEGMKLQKKKSCFI